MARRSVVDGNFPKVTLSTPQSIASNLNVLHLTAFGGGGAGVAAQRLVKAQRGYGIDAHLVTAEWPTSRVRSAQLRLSAIANYRIVPTGESSLPFPYFPFLPSPKVPMNARNLVVNLHWWPSVVTADVLSGLKGPIVWTLHDMWPITGGCFHSDACDQYLGEAPCTSCPQVRAPFRRGIARHAKRMERSSLANVAFVSPSEWLSKAATERFPRSICRTIPNPLDDEFFRPLASKPRHLESFTVVAVAANWRDPSKGADAVVESVVDARQYGLDVRLHIVGPGFPSGVAGWITQHGQVNSAEGMRRILDRADALLSCSVRENAPNVMLEASARGLPIVAFDALGSTEIISLAGSGVIAESPHHAGMEIRQLALNPGKVVELGTRGRRWVESQSHPHVVANRYLEFYSELVAAEGHA